MSQVFISYKREEKSSAFVAQLKDKLETAGFDVWIDQALLRAGQLWIQEIDNAIKASIALIVVLTPEAHQSLYVTYEWSFAIGRGMPIIPLLLEETEIHRRLQDIQYIDFRNHWMLPWDDLISRLNEINLGAISKQREIPPFIRRAVDAFESYDAEERKTAIQQLTRSSHPAALETLANAVHHHISDVRMYASITLADITDYRDERALPGLVEAFRSTNSYWYSAAGERLPKIFKNNLSFAHLLAELAENDNRPKLPYILKMIEAISASEYVESLVKFLTYEWLESSICDEIVSILVQIGEPGVSDLVKWINYPNSKVGHYVTIALGQIGGKLAILTLRDSIKETKTANVEAIEALGRLMDAESVPFLRNILVTHQSRLNQSIEEWRSMIGNFGDEERIQRNARNSAFVTTKAAIRALKNIGTLEAIAILDQWDNDLDQQG